jgi:predicted nucleic acid-binding Zn ribbon protein
MLDMLLSSCLLRVEPVNFRFVASETVGTMYVVCGHQCETVLSTQDTRMTDMDMIIGMKMQ